ncbi:right-handed parallel beta-helix repeat-containing protein [Paenibacillus aceris]|uniref:right-handed parallel beta-helix repeat-containing protein n=1 Tax=Paenibacillus aceris TaxID=869555 RepID=UPI001422C374|nr:right-handed parallel beta-helix repeat-containing protein [Paenibacillus aceris]NHW36668.1 right-handed parallel beta-helix repeat-containing protein [Paenibacillus aceris]
MFHHNTFLRPGTIDGYISTQAGHTLTGPEEEGPFSDPWGSYATPPHGAVYVHSGDRIHFLNCEFAKIGSTALIVTNGSRNCVIHNNVFTDLSGGAIYLGDAKHTSDIAPDPHQVGPHFSKTGQLDPPIVPLEERELSYNNTISNNLVEWTGKQFSDTVAIWAGYESNLKLVHNTIQHVSYTGINVGWGWRETGRQSRMCHNYIAYNRITDYLRKEADMHDGGGLYMINAMPGTIVEYNYFNNKTGIGNAVYFDAGLDYAVLRYNVMTNIHHKWVSANGTENHRGMIAYNNYTEKGYGIGPHQHTFDGEYTIMGDNYIHMKMLPKEAIDIARNAGHHAPYDEHTIDLICLDADNSTIPFVKDTSASLNKSRPNEISYEVYANGSEIVAVFIDGKEVAAGAFKTADKTFVRNAFLATDQKKDFLASVGETNKWYPYVKTAMESLREEPCTVQGKALVLDQTYLCETTIEIGKHIVTMRFANGFDLVVDLDVCENN